MRERKHECKRFCWGRHTVGSAEVGVHNLDREVPIEDDAQDLRTPSHNTYGNDERT